MHLPNLLLADTGEVAVHSLTLGQGLGYAIGIVFFLLLNAFFVASEFAIVKVRASQLEAETKDKPRRLRTAKHIVEHLDGYLSATQLGITIASLVLGFLGEPFIAALVGPALELTGLTPWWVSKISFVLALAVFTVAHVVIGELIPKSIAIRLALPVTLALARPLHAFYVAFKYPIALFNSTANFILKHVLRIEPAAEGEHVHTSDELALLVAESERAQKVTETEREILINALELNELWVRDVMTPRNSVIVLDANDPFEKTLESARRTKHTRFPLVVGHLDHAIGLIHIKDLLKLVGAPNPDLMRIKRELKVVPDTMPLDVLLKFFLKEHAHLALVADEFGHAAGIVFLDNVIEELVGDIQDEFDNERSEFVRLNDDEFVIEGSMTLNDLAGHVPELFLESGEVTTVGGYITQQLARFPEVGESIEFLGYEAKVNSSDGRRVGQLHFRKLHSENAESEEHVEVEEQEAG